MSQSEETTILLHGSREKKQPLSDVIKKACMPCIIICCILFLLTASSYIAVGTIYLNDCSMEPMIPIYLLATGSSGFLLGFLKLLQTRIDTSKHKSLAICDDILSFGSALLAVFTLGWFIAGCVWVYINFATVQVANPNESITYCNEILYYFSLSITSIILVILLFVTLLCCCGICFGVCTIAVVVKTVFYGRRRR